MHRPAQVAGYRKKRPDPCSDIEKSTWGIGAKDSSETTAPYCFARAGDLDPLVVRGGQRAAARDLLLGWAGFHIPMSAVPAPDDGPPRVDDGAIPRRANRAGLD
jgi:hypothetical protein